ncbi:MAG: alpha-hydroxy acid oxidase [Chloroflexota bacterium]
MGQEPAPINLFGYEARAEALLPPDIHGYFAGGAEDETSIAANREAFAQWRLLPRVLRGVASPDLSTSILGQDVSLPVLLTPLATQRLVHSEGERASARAAREAGTTFILSTSASLTIEEVAPAAGNWWFQLYVQRDRAVTEDLVHRAEAAGAGALVLTVDLPIFGRRERDLHYGFRIPADMRPYDAAPARVDGLSVEGPYQPLRWDDLAWLNSLSRLPLVLKGILAPDDARLAVDHGAQAIVVSNHGGRQLDGAVASLDALPAVVAATHGRAEILMDGGIRRGADVLKALALGAGAVLLGRPFVWGLAVNGEAGVLHVLNLLREELATAMLLCGCASVQEISQELLVPPGELPVAPLPDR